MEGELRLLRYFVTVAEELHFGRAAARLHISQPPLSRAIRRLEDRTGAELFVRSSRTVVLSPAGEALLPHARILIERADAAAAAVRRVSRGDGSLAVGYLSAHADRVVPELVQRLRAERSGLAVDLVEGTTPQLLAAVRAGELDATLLYSSRVAPVWAADLDITAFRTERLYAALPRSHHLVGRDEIESSELAGEDWISLAASALPEGADRDCHRRVEQGFDVKLTATTVRSCLDLVAAGLGACFAPYSATRTRLDAIAYVPVAGLALDLVCVHAPEPAASMRALLRTLAAVLPPEPTARTTRRLRPQPVATNVAPAASRAPISSGV